MTKSLEEVRAVLSKMSGVKPADISYGTRLRYDLNLNDVEMLALNQWVEDTYKVEITDEARESLHRVSDVLTVISRAR